VFRAGRHLFLHLGGALGAVVLACAVPALMAPLLGARWPLLVLAVAALSFLAFAATLVWKILRWMRAPVPFRIPLTLGQQKSIASVSHSRSGTPHALGEVLWRMFLDIVLFRPLFRATPTAPATARGLSHGMGRSLWFIAVAFHASLLIILVRHLRLILDPVPAFVALLERFDVATEMVLPKVHITSLLFPLALALLFGRRLLLMRVRYISLAADYFPLLLLSAIATTGIVMRHFVRTDLASVKQIAMWLVYWAPVLAVRPDPWLVVHVFLVGVLFVYFPLSKLMHLPGVLLSPTLTMSNNNRERRHINPRNPDVVTMHYTDYEDVFRERMIEAGLPVEKAPEGK